MVAFEFWREGQDSHYYLDLTGVKEPAPREMGFAACSKRSASHESTSSGQHATNPYLNTGDMHNPHNSNPRRRVQCPRSALCSGVPDCIPLNPVLLRPMRCSPVQICWVGQNISGQLLSRNGG